MTTPLKCPICPCQKPDGPACSHYTLDSSYTASINLSGIDAFGWSNVDYVGWMRGGVGTPPDEQHEFPLKYIDGDIALTHVKTGENYATGAADWAKRLTKDFVGCYTFLGVPQTLYFLPKNQSGTLASPSFKTVAIYPVVVYNFFESLYNTNTPESGVTVWFEMIQFKGSAAFTDDLDPNEDGYYEVTWERAQELLVEIAAIKKDDLPDWCKYYQSGIYTPARLVDPSYVEYIRGVSHVVTCNTATTYISAFLWENLKASPIAGKFVFSTEYDFKTEYAPMLDPMPVLAADATFEERQAWNALYLERKAIYDEWVEKNNTSKKDWITTYGNTVDMFAGIKNDQMLPFYNDISKPEWLPAVADFTLSVSGINYVVNP